MRKLPCILVIFIALAILGCPIEQESPTEYKYVTFSVKRSVVNNGPEEKTFDNVKKYIDNLKSQAKESDGKERKTTRDSLYVTLTKEHKMSASDASRQIEILKKNENNYFTFNHKTDTSLIVILYAWR
jgi:P2-related tail formation protein